MSPLPALVSFTALIAALVLPHSQPQQPSAKPPVVWITLRDGSEHIGALDQDSLQFAVEGKDRAVPVVDLLSFHSAAAASEREAATIARELPRLLDKDVAATEAAAAMLVDIGLPVVTPLLQSFADTDAHEPDARYRLFARLVPGEADARDRTLDLIRLRDGALLRGHWTARDLVVTDAAGAHTVPGADVRRIAVKQARVHRSFELQALHQCTYVGWLDTGIVAADGSRMTADARGYVRLSFDEDGWSTGPDGIHDPLPGKRKLQEGFRWGCVLYRVGAAGERRFCGSHLEQDHVGAGRLAFVVNDNEHWQNNIGSYRVEVTVSDAFDVGDAR